MGVYQSYSKKMHTDKLESNCSRVSSMKSNSSNSNASEFRNGVEMVLLKELEKMLSVEHLDNKSKAHSVPIEEE